MGKFIGFLGIVFMIIVFFVAIVFMIRSEIELEPKTNEFMSYSVIKPQSTGGGSSDVHLERLYKYPQNVINSDYTVSMNEYDLLNLTITWNVENGVGCCNTYFCDKDWFFSDCIYPDFNLYDIELNGVIFDWSYVDTSLYEYECNNNTPWNYFNYYNLTHGTYNIVIYQKDCINVIDRYEMVIVI